MGLAAAVTYLVSVPEVYKSSARILLDRSVNRYLQTSKILDEPTFDDVDISSQIYVLSSDSVVVPVVRSMNLAHDPEFVGSTRDAESVSEICLGRFSSACFSLNIKKLKEIKEIVKQSIGLKAEAAIDPNTALERTAVETLLSQLSVTRTDVPNVIDITFGSVDSKKAANIANALADTYIAMAGANRLSSSKMVSQLLEERLTELKQQSVNADRALQEFKTANNLSITLTPDNPLIMRLRSQYVDLATKANEIETTVGPKHLAVVKIRKQMNELNAAIRGEEERIAGSSELNAPIRGEEQGIPGDGAYADEYYPAEARNAGARNNELSASLAKLDSQKQAKYRELDISDRALRTVYNSALRKFNAINQIRPDTEDTRIITRAAPPLRKSPKKTLAVLGGGIVFGLLMGIGAAIGREWADGVFRTSEQVKRATGIYCAILPTVEARFPLVALNDYVLDAPYSRFTETIRNIRALINASQRANGDKVICVVSSVSKEGKTTVANNLAALLSSRSKFRTLIIDCDLHQRNVTAELAPDAREGLIEALGDPSRLAKLVVKRERSGAGCLAVRSLGTHSERS